MKLNSYNFIHLADSFWYLKFIFLRYFQWIVQDQNIWWLLWWFACHFADLGAWDEGRGLASGRDWD